MGGTTVIIIFMTLMVFSLLIESTTTQTQESTNHDPTNSEFTTAIASSKSLENGKKRLDEVISRMNLPYGECWLKARARLGSSCHELDAIAQTKLAFGFTSCFLKMMGFDPPECDEDQKNIQDCLKALDTRGYSTFLEYFQHTQDMCFYLSNQLWQAKTAETVGRLENVAQSVTQNLESSKTAQKQILESQQEALNVTKNIISDNSHLYNTVLKVKQVFDDFQESAIEQRQVFVDIFEKLSKMQRLVSWIQGEMSFLDMFGFYGVSLLLGYLITSTKRTNEARFILIILLTTVFITERFLYKYLTSEKFDMSPDDVQAQIDWIRKIACGIGFVVIGYFSATYHDYNMMNNRALNGVNQNLDRVNRNVDESFRQMSLQMTRVMRVVNANRASTLAVEARHSNDSDNDSDSGSSSSSAYSRDSDSLSTATLIDADESSMLLEDIKLHYPDLDKENTPSNPQRTQQVNDKDDVGQAIGLPILSSTPIAHGSRYNLRERRSSTKNPILKTESPKDFAMTVKAIQKRNAHLRQSMKDACYSSDDDY